MMNYKGMKYIEYISNNMYGDTVIIENDDRCILAPYLDGDMFIYAHSLDEFKQLNMEHSSLWLTHKIRDYIHKVYGIGDFDIIKKSFEVYRDKMVRFIEEKNLSNN